MWRRAAPPASTPQVSLQLVELLEDELLLLPELLLEPPSKTSPPLVASVIQQEKLIFEIFCSCSITPRLIH